jgi:hypothetical protein
MRIQADLREMDTESADGVDMELPCRRQSAFRWHPPMSENPDTGSGSSPMQQLIHFRQHGASRGPSSRLP